MSILQNLNAKRADYGAELMSSTARAVMVVAAKGGVGKTTITEVTSTVLQDSEVPHTIAECEANRRIEGRVAAPVTHHPLHKETVAQLARNPDLLNRYWDGVYRQYLAGPLMLGDLAANALDLLLRWASDPPTNAALQQGANWKFVLVATADPESLSGTLKSAAGLAHVLPEAERWIVFNEIAGPVDLAHPGMQEFVKRANCQGPLLLSMCRAPHFSILRAQGGYFQTAMTATPTSLLRHGMDYLEAGRAICGLRDWVLDSCGIMRPVVKSLLKT
ncbi:hypothetical protein [Falsiroseomonas sp. HW251]|uniref:hypothetical protein n=1 Tax=Falsiroseomonas sp. HW251 TaxID=3390998 RepID=UPI003D315E49